MPAPARRERGARPFSRPRTLPRRLALCALAGLALALGGPLAFGGTPAFGGPPALGAIAGSATAPVTAPCSASLTASPTTQVLGQPVTLSWVTTGGTPRGLGGNRALPPTGSMSLASSTLGTATYVLNVYSSSNAQLCGASVTVSYVAQGAGPSASFTDTVSGLTAHFDASASSGSGPMTYLWSLGNGATGTGVLASYTYPAAGTYAVKLTVRDSAGSASAVHTVLVQAAAPATPTSSKPSGFPAGNTGDGLAPTSSLDRLVVSVDVAALAFAGIVFGVRQRISARRH